MTSIELNEILLNDNPSDFLRNKEKELFELIPELEECKGFNQNSDWHVYDVYEHILHVVNYVPKSIELRLAALFHDIGKPKTYIEDEYGIGHFYGHWNESIKVFKEFANNYNLDESITNKVTNLIFYHDLNISKLDDNKLNEMLSRFDSKGIEDLYKLKTADLLAQNKKYHYLVDDLNNQKEMIIKKIK